MANTYSRPNADLGEMIDADRRPARNMSPLPRWGGASSCLPDHSWLNALQPHPECIMCLNVSAHTVGKWTWQSKINSQPLYVNVWIEAYMHWRRHRSCLNSLIYNHSVWGKRALRCNSPDGFSCICCVGFIQMESNRPHQLQEKMWFPYIKERLWWQHAHIEF